MRTFQQFLEAMNFDLSLGHQAAVDDALDRGNPEVLLQNISERLHQMGQRMQGSFLGNGLTLFNSGDRVRTMGMTFSQMSRLVVRMNEVIADPKKHIKNSVALVQSAFGRNLDYVRQELQALREELATFENHYLALLPDRRQPGLLEANRTNLNYIQNAIKAAEVIFRHLKENFHD